MIYSETAFYNDASFIAGRWPVSFSEDYAQRTYYVVRVTPKDGTVWRDLFDKVTFAEVGGIFAANRYELCLQSTRIDGIYTCLHDEVVDKSGRQLATTDFLPQEQQAPEDWQFAMPGMPPDPTAQWILAKYAAAAGPPKVYTLSGAMQVTPETASIRSPLGWQRR